MDLRKGCRKINRGRNRYRGLISRAKKNWFHCTENDCQVKENLLWQPPQGKSRSLCSRRVNREARGESDRVRDPWFAVIQKGKCPQRGRCAHSLLELLDAGISEVSFCRGFSYARPSLSVFLSAPRRLSFFPFCILSSGRPVSLGSRVSLSPGRIFCKNS